MTASEIEWSDSVKASNGVDWYYIKYNDKYGFVSSKYIQKKSTTTTTTNTSNKVASAQSFSKDIAGVYKVSSNGLNLRTNTSTEKKDNILCVIPKGGKVTCYGYYTSVSGTKWYLVEYLTYTGFVSSKYLTK